ncbi:hypothetical protein EDD86DRAFT_84845 [Gorgonomyces haynaldii]|nr:hypothetical protein EDD86DRAFT_84845 [Gorgonomyces haynaldii]
MTWTRPVPPFEGIGDPTHTIGYLCSIVVNSLALCLNVLFMWSVLRKPRLRTVHNLWLVHISFIDTLLTMAYLIQTIVDIGREIPSLWQYETCQANGFTLQLLVGLTIINLMLMVLYQWYVICLERPPLTEKQAIFTMASTWIVVGLLASALLLSSRGYIPHVSGWHCATPLIHPNQVELGLAIFDIVLFVCTPFLISFLFYSILAKISKTQHYSRIRYISTNQRERSKEIMQRIERKVVERAIIISSTFVVTWFGLGIEWIITLARQEQLPWQAEMWISLVVRLNPMVNPGICIYLDPNVRASFLETFGVTIVDPVDDDSWIEQSTIVVSESNQ